jgi:hypothetical protein
MLLAMWRWFCRRPISSLRPHSEARSTDQTPLRLCLRCPTGRCPTESLRCRVRDCGRRPCRLLMRTYVLFAIALSHRLSEESVAAAYHGLSDVRAGRWHDHLSINFMMLWSRSILVASTRRAFNRSTPAHVAISWPSSWTGIIWVRLKRHGTDECVVITQPQHPPSGLIQW